MSAITADLPITAGLGRAPRAGAARTATRDVPLRLTRRGRVVVFLLALGAGLWALGGQVAAADAPAAAVPVQTYTVRAGETMWEIAAGIAAPGEDVRDVIDDVLELNEMSSAALTAGQQILLPAGR